MSSAFHTKQRQQWHTVCQKSVESVSMCHFTLDYNELHMPSQHFTFISVTQKQIKSRKKFILSVFLTPPSTLPLSVVWWVRLSTMIGDEKVDKSSEMLLMMSSQAFGTSSGFCTHKKRRERISHFHFLLSSFFSSIILFRILQSIILIERALGQSEKFSHFPSPPPLLPPSGDDDVKWRKTIL